MGKGKGGKKGRGEQTLSEINVWLYGLGPELTAPETASVSR